MNPFDDAPIIHTYTRKQAVEDGEQVDVSEVAREAGIRFPVYLARTVWGRYVEVPPKVQGQDEQGTLWDILSMFRWQAKRGGDLLNFRLYVRNDNRRPRLVTLKATCSANDMEDPQPAITIMLPDED